MPAGTGVVGTLAIVVNAAAAGAGDCRAGDESGGHHGQHGGVLRDGHQSRHRIAHLSVVFHACLQQHARRP